MALKDKWFNKENGVDDIDAEDINDIAEAVIEMEKKGVKDGTTFTPSVSVNGDLSWTNDGGRPNPPTVNIKGEDGKSAYQSAIDGGYVGDEAEFDYSLSKVPEAIQEMRFPVMYKFEYQGGNYSQLEVPSQKVGDIFTVFVPVGWTVQIEFSDSSAELITAESKDETYKFEITEDRQIVRFYVYLNSGDNFLVKDCPVTITHGVNRFEEIENKLGDIDKALDELHEYAQSLITGGGE